MWQQMHRVTERRNSAFEKPVRYSVKFILTAIITTEKPIAVAPKSIRITRRDKQIT